MSNSRREPLLKAATELINEVGHEALTIRMVAQRAGVSSATAYTYLGSRERLFAEMFWMALMADPNVDLDALPDSASTLARLGATIRHLVKTFAKSPELTEAVTSALLVNDPEVARLRVRIGAEFVRRFEAALGPEASAELIDALALMFSGGMLQAGMGIDDYPGMGERIVSAAALLITEDEEI